MAMFLIYAGVLLTVGLVVFAGYISFGAESRRADRVKDRLKSLYIELETSREASERGSIVKRRDLAGSSRLNELLGRVPGMNELAVQLERAGAQIRVSGLFAHTFAWATIGFSASYVLRSNVFIAAIAGIVCATFPWIWMFVRQAKRLKAVGAQLPDALDLLVRSLKAGHSLSSGFLLVSEEMPEPLSKEFGQLHEELKLGLDMEDALVRLHERLNLQEVRMMSTAILIQRESGGNLVEILESLGELMRKRKTFYDKLGAMTAEGKLSGWIMMLMPPVIFVVIGAIKPDYMGAFFEPGTPLKWAVLVAATLQLIGMIWIRKIVAVRY